MEYSDQFTITCVQNILNSREEKEWQLQYEFNMPIFHGSVNFLQYIG